ncbi:MAG: extracellular solute-binding protein [Clostridia bacterium]|nr:extracellular solute-binding protein [Clostridia bacterium]
MKKISLKELFSRIFFGILAVVLIVTLPFISIKNDDEFSQIYSVFVGSKSKYQGIIEVWNIDTFESGSSSKVSYIESVAKSFQKQNKGIYVLVRNLTEYECLNLLEKGEKPDLFSCSYGLASDIKNYITEFSNFENIDVAENLLNAGKINDKLYGLAWCKGFYILISSENHLKNTKLKDEIENIKLSETLLDLGYKKEGKKNTKIISSLTYGKNKYLMPNYAYFSYTNKGLISKSEFSLDENIKTNSQYSAYSNFVAGNSVVLLGSQRDYFRIENRVKNAKISDVIYEPLTSFTDLVQFTFLAKNENYLKKEYAEIFAKMLSSNKYQKRLSFIGMLPVTKQVDIYENGLLKELSNTDYFSKVNNVFIEKSEIINLQQS